MAVSVHTVQKKVTREAATDLTNGGPILGAENCEKHFSSRERQLGKRAADAAAARGECEGKGKTVDISHNGQQQVIAPEERIC